MAKRKRSCRYLKPHEVQFILGWSFRKVFRKLEAGVIPSERLENDGKVQFIVWPRKLSVWIAKKGLPINPKAEPLFQEKLRLDKERYDKTHQPIVALRESRRRFRFLRALRLEQQRLYDSLFMLSGEAKGDSGLPTVE